MKATRDIIEINEDLCNGCGQCVLDCAEGAIQIIDGKAKVIADHLCDGLGACLGGCPTGALKIIRRSADAYDEEAVEKHLAGMGRTHKPDHHGHEHGPHHGHGHGGHHGHGGGCPSAKAMSMAPSGGCPSGRAQSLPMGPGAAAAPAGNVHWPLKLRLMSPDAPFLKGARLLLAADCSAFAAPAFHTLKAGRVCLIACPKFEGMDALVERLAEIFTVSEPADVTVVRMEVPCCRALSGACEAARQKAGKQFPVTEVIVARDGGMSL